MIWDCCQIWTVSVSIVTEHKIYYLLKVVAVLQLLNIIVDVLTYIVCKFCLPIHPHYGIIIPTLYFLAFLVSAQIHLFVHLFINWCVHPCSQAHVCHSFVHSSINMSIYVHVCHSFIHLCGWLSFNHPSMWLSVIHSYIHMAMWMSLFHSSLHLCGWVSIMHSYIHVYVFH